MISTDKKKKYALVVLSHSSYADLWPILTSSYDAYFNNSEFDCFLATDDKINQVPTYFNVIEYSQNIPWGTALKEIISKLKYDKVIFTFDDLVLKSSVDVEKLISYLDNSVANYQKLICSHVRFYERFFKTGLDFSLSSKDSYRGSLVFACLDKVFLDFLLFLITSFKTFNVVFQISSGLCSTQPSFGKYCVNSV